MPARVEHTTTTDQHTLRSQQTVCRGALTHTLSVKVSTFCVSERSLVRRGTPSRVNGCCGARLVAGTTMAERWLALPQARIHAWSGGCTLQHGSKRPQSGYCVKSCNGRHNPTALPGTYCWPRGDVCIGEWSSLAFVIGCALGPWMGGPGRAASLAEHFDNSQVASAQSIINALIRFFTKFRH